MGCPLDRTGLTDPDGPDCSLETTRDFVNRDSIFYPKTIAETTVYEVLILGHRNFLTTLFLLG